ncbi:ImmA/IrrE family metallo-endopeptidase [Pseudomonas syringae]|uniref:ImmA/IrrE family metallo-endopeptidase n=1 Tax=Pseudomonas syringae TaxID=317 RepID=UPI001BCF9028|nr:ImmA/IrrE family metallo-endopeptidase [Pseudomonas syringae]MBS7422405.1 ImmA/IrrE family metallo-endopeptidase [Pseudomonas syringae]MBS7434159.1 ImmA/IrrE family metallo-endopeptidase [Pseudomonas syringae]
MARRVLARRNLLPPFDLNALATEYGELDYLDLPYEVDGITIGIGSAQKPRILVNASAPATRRKFTLAHELGHIVIPWHTGTIISHLDSHQTDAAYMQMEAEANRFAAELLMPADWLTEQFESTDTVEAYFRKVQDLVGASREAMFYKLFKSLPTPIICVQVDNDSRVLNGQRSPSAPSVLSAGALAGPSCFIADNRYEEFEIDGQRFVSWWFVGREIKEIDPRPWRAIYSDILNETGMQGSLQSISAILAGACNKNKAQSEHDICGAVYRAFSNYERYETVVNHPLFEQYVIKRVRELKLRH